MSDTTLIERMKFVPLTQDGAEKNDAICGLLVSDKHSSFFVDTCVDEDGNLYSELPFDDVEVLAIAMRHETAVMDSLVFDIETHDGGIEIGDNLYDSEDMEIMIGKAKAINEQRTKNICNAWDKK